MEALHEFLEDLKRQGRAQDHFLGLLHVLIGRRIERSDGTLIANGVTWRVVAECLVKVRWDKEAVQELGLSPEDLPPRDRLRYWYMAIARSQVDSAKAAKAGDAFGRVLRKAGYVVGPGPGQSEKPPKAD